MDDPRLHREDGRVALGRDVDAEVEAALRGVHRYARVVEVGADGVCDPEGLSGQPYDQLRWGDRVGIETSRRGRVGADVLTFGQPGQDATLVLLAEAPGPA